jgi:predicted PurR-regulated permease PerM
LALRLTAIGLEFGRTAIYIFVTLVVAFFLAVEPNVILRQLQRFVPPPHRPRATRIAVNIHQRIGAWARGQLLIAIIFGAAMGAGLRLIGVPYAWSLGVVAGILEVVPYVGGAITVVLAALSAGTVGLPLVIAVVILYVVLVSVESHILAPLLYGRALGLPPVAILLALLAGVELLGNPRRAAGDPPHHHRLGGRRRLRARSRVSTPNTRGLRPGVLGRAGSLRHGLR